MSCNARTFQIPEAFPEILWNFAKEAIRGQPKDIYGFGYDYFEKLMRRNVAEVISADTLKVDDSAEESMGTINLGIHKVETLGVVDNVPPPSKLQLDDALSDRIALLFQEADTDGNGTLSRKEFTEVFELIGSEIGLTSVDVLHIMAEADNNDDGVIEYREFIPVATEIIHALMAKEEYSSAKDIRSKRNSGMHETKDYLMKGLPRHELEASIQEIFRGADRDNSGVLEREEFLRCLRGSGLGFTRQELNLVLTLIDKNNDGVIDYQEFMPICFSMIVKTLCEKIQEVPEGEMKLREDVFERLLAATGGESRLTTSQALDCLGKAGLGLRVVQVHAIMSTVEEEKDGRVEAKEVAEAVAGVMSSLKKIHARQHDRDDDEYVAAFKTARDPEKLATVAGFNAHEFATRLTGMLKTMDDRNDETVANKDVFREALSEVFPELTPQQMHALDSLLESREDGRWGYRNVALWGFSTLQEVASQAQLVESFNPTESQ